MSGQIFGHWSVLHLDHKRGVKRFWLCQCLCGVTKAIASHSLKSGQSTSCGCRFRKSMERHGYSRSPEYAIWQAMKNRCLNPNVIEYKRYGGRGITVCDRWRVSFSAFLSNMGPRPSRHHSIERTDNERGYDPGNCRWATNQEQSNNRHTNKLLTANGRTDTWANWSRESGIPYKTLHNRLHKGWSPERALTTPVRDY